jgi:hypothetical protein
MSTILQAALPKAKFNRMFCRKTIVGPGSHGGQEIHNLQTSQIIAHADTVIHHGMASTLAGQQLRGSLEAAKLELGLPGPLFQQDFKAFGSLATDSWVKHAWKEFQLEEVEVTEQTANI